MSIQTMNWALQQRLESPLHQVLLYVIADSAAPDGVTRHCDSDYLVDRARMSRATVFRKLADLRDWGLVETFTHHGERGQQIYEVRLQLKKFVDMPIRKRKTGDDEGESHSETPAESGQSEGGESHCETPPQSHCETGAVSPERLGQSQSGDCICPPVSKETPPNPPPGGGVNEAEREERGRLFAVLRRDYPTPSVWNWAKAEAAFTAMDLADCRKATAAANAYAHALSRPRQPKPMRPDRWLRERMFENFPDAKIPEAPAAAPEPVWYPDDSEEAQALAVAHALAGEPPPAVHSRADVPGRWIKRLRPVGPDLLRLAAWHGAIATGEFPIEHAAGSAGCEAWRARLGDWTGREVKPRRIWTEPFDPNVHGVSALDARFRMRSSFTGLRVPWLWPPRRDGTMTPEDAAREAAPATNHREIIEEFDDGGADEQHETGHEFEDHSDGAGE